MATTHSKFITNTIIIVFIVVAIGGVMIWRLTPKAESSLQEEDATSITGEQSVTLNVETSGFSPDTFTVRQGTKITLHLVTNNTQGCIRSFVIPDVGIRKTLPATGTTTVEFVASKKGTIAFQCSMGMFRGSINVL